MGEESPLYIKKLFPQFLYSGVLCFEENRCSPTGLWIQSSRYHPDHRFLYPILFNLNRYEIIHPGWKPDDGNYIARPICHIYNNLACSNLTIFKGDARKLWTICCKLCSRELRVLFAACFHIIQEITFLKEPMNSLKIFSLANLPKMPCNSGGIFKLPDQRKDANLKIPPNRRISV